MTQIYESRLYGLCLALLTAYDGSAVHRLLARAGRWCSRQIKESRVLRPLCREGAVARAWPSSVLCRVLTALANLPARLLYRLYAAFRPAFDGSVFARLAFAVGDGVPAALFWVTALLWCVPFEYWNNAYSMTGFALLLAVFHAGAMHRRDLRLDVEALGFYPLVLFGSMFLAAAVSASRASSLRFLLYHVSAALLALAAVSAVRTGEELKRAAAGAAVCVGVSGAYGVVQRIQGVEVNPSYVDLRVNAGMPGRVYSFFDNPNTFAEVLLLLLPLALALVLCSRSLWGRLAAGGAFLVGAVALAMTYSRASWVGFAVSMAVFVFLWRPELIPAFAVLCCAAVPFLPDTVWNRILTIANTSDSSTAARIPLYEAALAVIRRSPVLGAGLGTAAVQDYIAEWNLYHGEYPYVHAHSIYLEVWVEAGLPGIAAFLASMLWNIKRTARTVRHSVPSPARTVSCAAAASLCGAMVCGLADYLWNYPRVLCMFWFVFALALAGVRICRAAEE